MLLLFRRPSRVACGSLPGPPAFGSSCSTFSVTGRMAHAWPEAFFQGIGWVAFEPTPRADAPPPDYTVAPAPVAAPATGTSPSPESSEAPSPAPTAAHPAPNRAETPHNAS